MSEPADVLVTTPARVGASRRAIVVVIIIDLVIATATGFAVYFATRRFGPPTVPRAVEAVAATCIPDDCDVLSSTVTLTWKAPEAGGLVTAYVVFRDDHELERIDPGSSRFLDNDLFPGQEHRYAVRAIGDEGEGPLSAPVSVDVPLPPTSFARLDGTYRVEVTIVKVDLLSRFEGIHNPSAGDSTHGEWELQPDCFASQGSCAVRFELLGMLQHVGALTYHGKVPAEAKCGDVTVHSTTTMSITVTDVAMRDGVLTVTSFEGKSTTEFLCGDHHVHAVSTVTGRLS